MEDLAALFNWLGNGRGFSAIGEYFAGETPADLSLPKILGLEPEMLKPFTQEMLESLKENDFITSVKSGFRALCEFQDVFPLTIKAKEINQLDYAQLINRNYCYYESLVYLRSSIVAALDKNPVAATTLLRPFLELSVLQLFWFTRCEIEGYGWYYEWLKGGPDKPGFSRQLEQVIKKLPARQVIPKDRLQRLKETLQNMYRGFCKYSHSPRINESLAGMSGAHTGMSLDSFYFYLANLDLLISQIVYLYILAYPMILFPVERTKKWGVDGPIGIYVERNNYSILQAYLGSNCLETLRTRLALLPQVTSLLESFDSQPDLTDYEQEEVWNGFVERVGVKENPPQWPARIALNRSYSRALGWSLNYIQPRVSDDELRHEEVKKVFEAAKSW
jgi:hypothetical protein